MNKKQELKTFFLLVFVFLLFYFLPTESDLFLKAVFSGLNFLHEYAKNHVLTCLLPAFFIAGAISVFVKKDYILKYLGGQAKKYIAYSLASISGAILAVCSCTILPLFAGIRKRGAGLGPAITFLFSGPAINITAMFLTISVLGAKIGLARIFFAILISILVGLSMQMLFKEKSQGQELGISNSKEVEVNKRFLAIFFAAMIGVLIVNGLQIAKFIKYLSIILLTVAVAIIAIFKFHRETTKEWLKETWGFAKLLLPTLFAGVFVAGFAMPFLPQSFIEKVVGGNSILGNLLAAIFGAFMYFSTLTEIPILQALIAKGMGQGPALALLLAGPSLSLPSMLTIRKVLGTKKTAAYVLLVIIYSTIAGLIFGYLV